MKLFAEFLPLLLFFAAFKLYDIFVATAVLMVTSVLQLLIIKLKGNKPTQMQIYSTVAILGFGALTLYFRDAQFVKIKVTVINWLFAGAFLSSHYLGKQTFIERLFETLHLPGKISRRLNAAYAVFFFFLGALNLFIFMHFSTDVWVNFKVWGLMGLTLLFMMVQLLYLKPYVQFTGGEEKNSDRVNDGEKRV